MTIDQEIRLRAEEMFVIDGMTLEEVAAELEDVSIGTLKRWSVEGGWKGKRREYQDAEAEIRRYSRLSRLKLIKDVYTSLDPQKVYAFSALEKVSGQISDLPLTPLQEGTDEIVHREIKTPEDAVAALQEAIEIKLRLMLTRPDALNFKAVKDLRDALALVDEMKAEKAVDEKTMRKQGLSDETAEEIRKHILGIQ